MIMVIAIFFIILIIFTGLSFICPKVNLPMIATGATLMEAASCQTNQHIRHWRLIKKIQKTKYKKKIKKYKQNTTGATLMEALEATSSTYPGIWYKLILFCFIHNFKRRENMKPCSCYATDQQILKRKDNQMIANGATLMEAASCQTNLNPPHFRYWWLKQNDFFAVLWFW